MYLQRPGHHPAVQLSADTQPAALGALLTCCRTLCAQYSRLRSLDHPIVAYFQVSRRSAALAAAEERCEELEEALGAEEASAQAAVQHSEVRVRALVFAYACASAFLCAGMCCRAHACVRPSGKREGRGKGTGSCGGARAGFLACKRAIRHTMRCAPCHTPPCMSTHLGLAPHLLAMLSPIAAPAYLLFRV